MTNYTEKGSAKKLLEYLLTWDNKEIDNHHRQTAILFLILIEMLKCKYVIIEYIFLCSSTH